MQQMMQAKLPEAMRSRSASLKLPSIDILAIPTDYIVAVLVVVVVVV